MRTARVSNDDSSRAGGRSSLVLGFTCVLLGAPELGAQVHGQNTSECSNCELLAGPLIEVSSADRIDFDQISPDRRLEFLLGDWVVHFPREARGTETFRWHYEGESIHGLQRLPGQAPAEDDFLAHSFYRFVANEERYEMVWIARNTWTVFSGAFEGRNTLALYKHEWAGDAEGLSLSQPKVRHVLKNISDDQFLVEVQEDRDEDGAYELVRWRALMKRSEAP